MLVVLVLLFVVLPLVELYVMVQVAQEVGFLWMLGLLIGISVIGTWVARTEGFLVLNRIREQFRQRRVPDVELIDGALVLMAGVLLVFPGFVTDVLAIVLLLPPTRMVLRGIIRRRVRFLPLDERGRGGPDDVIDV